MNKSGYRSLMGFIFSPHVGLSTTPLNGISVMLLAVFKRNTYNLKKMSFKIVVDFITTCCKSHLKGVVPLET